ncbi:MAG: hemolysin family protein [Candidatus Algichlamydia australiensis]|nr:hemolysin family protein [Chlamydiales bacterium]
MLITILVLLIVLSGFLSGSETSLFSLSSMHIKSFGSSKKRGEQVAARLLKSPRKLLVTILMLNVVMNILVQNVVSSIFGVDGGFVQTVGIPLALTLIFGEVIPKSIALPNNRKVAPKVAPIIQFFEKIFAYPRDLVTKICNWISHHFYFFLRPEEEISVRELKHALKTSKEYGILNLDEAKLLGGYLNLEEDLVKELMRPRGEILYYNVQDSLDSLLKLFREKEITRVPVVEGDLNQIKGIISSYAFLENQEKIKKPVDLYPFLQAPLFVPESVPASHLIQELTEKRLGLAVDEFGAVAGLITFEDLVEVVIGQIEDPHDEGTLFTKAKEDIIIASGKLELSTLEEIFGVELISPSSMATISGYLIEMMGDIPKPGQKFVEKGLLFHVLAADEKRIRRIYIRKVSQ